MEDLIRQFDDSRIKIEQELKKWEGESIVKATLDFLSSFMHIFPKNSPDSMNSVEEIANIKEDIQDISEMFLTLHNNFKNYIDFDSSAIKEGKFQPSYEFEVILSQSTTYLKRAMNFDQIQDVAATLFNRISNETKYEGDENDKLYKLLSKITLIAQLFVTQVLFW